MNKERINGAVDEAVGSTKRHIGNLTGDTKTQVEGATQQIKGKVETAVGKIKDNIDTRRNVTHETDHVVVVHDKE
jgi:uncharacterized protein YjbJ (UPF0337 family)